MTVFKKYNLNKAEKEALIVQLIAECPELYRASLIKPIEPVNYLEGIDIPKFDFLEKMETLYKKRQYKRKGERIKIIWKL